MSSKKKNESFGTSDNKLLTNKLLGAFRSHPAKSYNNKQLSKLLNIYDHGSRLEINLILEELAKNRILEEVGHGKYRLMTPTGYVTGIIEFHSQDQAIVISEEISEPIQIQDRNPKHALHGDTVKVLLISRKKKAVMEGEVVQVIKRGKETYVGTIEHYPSYSFLIPDAKNMFHDILIPNKNLKGARHGFKAIVRITDWPAKSKNPCGEVLEILGKSGDNEADIHAILAEYDLPYKFPEDLENLASKIQPGITTEEIRARRDFRDILTFTIDPEDAKDFDDALSIRPIKEGVWEVGVHIADVTHYVKEDDFIDEEALERGTSVYLVDRVVPMLPEHLSNFVCSLRPMEEKLCFSAVFELDESAKVLSEWYGKTVIRSNRRYSYEEAQETLKTGEGDFAYELALLNQLAKSMRKKRFKNGAIGFEKMETKFKLDEASKPIGVYQKIPVDSNHLIEEFMLLANKRVAEFIGKKEGKGKARTFVYRIHEQPNPEKISQFSNFIVKLGLDPIKSLGAKSVAAAFNKLLLQTENSPKKNIIETQAIRAMSKAEYSTQNVGHYGLAFTHYSHFTSPIRRYPDMIAHRLLFRYLNGGNSVDEDKYERECKHLSHKEQRAAQAERASVKYKHVEYMSDKVGKTFDGTISGMTDWGIYVEILDTNGEGMIPLRTLEDDYYYYDEKNFCVTGRRTGRQFHFGDPISVIVEKANLNKRQLDLSPAEKFPKARGGRDGRRRWI